MLGVASERSSLLFSSLLSAFASLREILLMGIRALEDFGSLAIVRAAPATTLSRWCWLAQLALFVVMNSLPRPEA